MAAAATRLPPSGLQKFPSNRSNASEGERDGRRALSLGQLSATKRDRRTDGTAVVTCWLPAVGRKRGRGPQSGQCRAVWWDDLPIPHLAGGVTDWPTMAGKPSSQHRGSCVTAPSAHVMVISMEAWHHPMRLGNRCANFTYPAAPHPPPPLHGQPIAGLATTATKTHYWLLMPACCLHQMCLLPNLAPFVTSPRPALVAFPDSA